MCVRIDQHEPCIKTLRKQCADFRQLKLKLSDSVYPGQSLAVLRGDSNQSPEAGICEWGLLPPWSKERNFGRENTFNARCETLHDKVCFKRAFQSQRCAIPVNAFWEHIKNSDEKGMVRFSKKKIRYSGWLAFGNGIRNSKYSVLR